MDWETIRAHYERLFDQSQQSQRDVATQAGLSGQNVISRMLSNRRRGPAVETFVKAIIALGITPSDFFEQIERAAADRTLDVIIHNAPHGDRVVQVKPSAIDAARFPVAMAAFWRALIEAERPRRRSPRRRRRTRKVG